eukprot:TRINITY_DN7683_c0_g1_i1.p1 TRINITY_DN7683_c0_g1~~TRINITY_DN7683_c0_g1_i1.p1  ORF type:complete len:1122 (-),score=246.83 TRINITY_DN7683_c0_g1_i1:39-3404(-)
MNHTQLGSFSGALVEQNSHSRDNNWRSHGDLRTPSQQQGNLSFTMSDLSFGGQPTYRTVDKRRAIHETSRHLLESHVVLPQRIQNLLNSLDDLSEVTARIVTGEVAEAIQSPSGILIVAFPSEVNIWPCAGGETNVLRIELPASESPYEADLIHLFLSSNNDNNRDGPPIVSLLAVTYEGSLRYWPSIFDSVNNCYPAIGSSERVLLNSTVATNSRYVAAVEKFEDDSFVITIDNQLYLVSINDTDRPILIKQLQRSGGVLAGLGRMLRWNAPAPTDSIRSIVVQNDPSKSLLFVMTENELQCWSGIEMKSKHDLRSLVSRALSDSLQGYGHQKSYLLDLQLGKKLNTIYVLVGSEAIDYSNQDDDTEVALFSIFQFEIQQPNFELGEQSFFTLPYQPRSDHTLSIFDSPTRLIVVDPDAYIVWPSAVLLTKVPYDDRILDMIEETREQFVGWGKASDRAFVVSSRRGVISISQPSLGTEEKIAIFEPPSILRTAKDDGSKLGALFWKYCRDRRPNFTPRELQEIVDLDAAVQTVSGLIIESFFERQNDNAPRNVVKEVVEKRKKHRRFVEMISHLIKLRPLSQRTFAVLMMNEEKAEVARELQEHYKTVRSTMKDHIPQQIKSWLNSRESTQIGQIMPASIQCLNSLFQGNDPEKLVSLLKYSNEVFNICFSKTLDYIKNTQVPQFVDVIGEEYVPWTAEHHEHMLLEAELTYMIITRLPGGDEILLQQLLSLCDNLLASWLITRKVVSNDFVRSEDIHQEFVKAREKLINLVDALRRTDDAMRLAEKYEYFEYLIAVCDAQGEKERLIDYMRQFREQNFAMTLFDWYLRNGKASKLFELPSEFNRALQEYLKNKGQLSWILDLKLGNFFNAAATLQHLGVHESKFVDERELHLSLSTLGFLAASNGTDYADRELVNNQYLYLARHQRKVFDENKVIDPSTMIHVLLSDAKNPSERGKASEALDILAHSTNILLPNEFAARKEDIWRSALDITSKNIRFSNDSFAAYLHRSPFNVLISYLKKERNPAVKGKVMLQWEHFEDLVSRYITPLQPKWSEIFKDIYRKELDRLYNPKQDDSDNDDEYIDYNDYDFGGDVANGDDDNNDDNNSNDNYDENSMMES